jgi:flagellar biogenesis protein FliO
MDADGGGLLTAARTLIALVGVCALAWVTLLYLSRRGFGGRVSGSRLHLLERLALGPRRQLYLVQADSRVFLLGAAESGAISVITELESMPPPPKPGS